LAWIGGGGDILALSANNVQMGGIDTSREAYFGSDRLYARWMTNGDPARGDVLMTLEAPLGNVAQVPDDRRYILSQRVILIRFSGDAVSNDFAFWQLICDPFQRAMIKFSTGTTATGIQRAKLVLILFAVPPLEEQQAIDERLRTIEARLAAERSTAHKLRLQKSGLMDDLLTGRVRVTPLVA
jgi:type I restriction enzyme S subunit